MTLNLTPQIFFSSVCFGESSALVDEDMNSIGNVCVSDILVSSEDFPTPVSDALASNREFATQLENCFSDFISDDWSIDTTVPNNGMGECY